MAGRIDPFRLEDSDFSVLSALMDFSVDSDGELTRRDGVGRKPRAVWMVPEFRAEPRELPGSLQPG